MLWAFGLYFLVLLMVGVLSYKRSKNAEEFVLGGRSLNFWVASLSAHASDMSSWIFMAYPAAIYLFGGVKIWVAIGLWFGMLANWLLVAPRLRTESERLGAVTLGGYFSKRYGDPSGILRILGACISLLFFTVYIASGLVAIGYLFDAILGIDPLMGISVGIAIVILYTIVGGFVSVCWIDMFQALFLLLMITLVPIVALAQEGGFGEMLQVSAERGLSWSIWPDDGWLSLLQICLISFGWGLGYFGQTHILTKFMGMRDPKEMKKAMAVGMVWQALILAAGTLVGMAAVAFFRHGIGNSELVFVLMVKETFLPFFAGLVLCAIFAAIISTVDSQILVLVSVVAEDLYHRWLRRDASAKETVISSRVSVVIIAFLAYLVAALSGQNVLSLVFYAWSGLGSTFGPVLVLALYSKRVNRYGAVTGLVFGGLCAAFWPLIDPLFPMEIPALIPGFLLNLVIIYLVSIATNQRISHEKA